MDRQLADGGWNVGTTVTFGKQMWPTPEATGIGSASLGGTGAETAVREEHRLPAVATAGPERPDVPGLGDPGASRLARDRWIEPHERILQVLARQEKLGPYDTVSLSLLLLAWHCDAGLVRFLEDKAAK